MNRRIVGALAAMLSIGIEACAGTLPRVEAPPKKVEELYRPGWTAGIGLHIDDIRLCVADRQAPTSVVHVQALASGGTGVTAIDGLGHAENCAVLDGRVVMRESADVEPTDLAGLPLFAPAPDQPTVGLGVLLEEVAEKEVLLGWLYWPHEGYRSGEREPPKLE